MFRFQALNLMGQTTIMKSEKSIQLTPNNPFSPLKHDIPTQLSGLELQLIFLLSPDEFSATM